MQPVPLSLQYIQGPWARTPHRYQSLQVLSKHGWAPGLVVRIKLEMPAPCVGAPIFELLVCSQTLLPANVEEQVIAPVLEPLTPRMEILTLTSTWLGLGCGRRLGE